MFDRPDVRKIPNWVVADDSNYKEFKTFIEAFDWQLEHAGHLMTKEYYTYHWLPEKIARLKEWNDENF